MQAALEKKLFHLLKACKEFVPKNICRIAALEGNLDVLKWARANGFFWNKSICSGAAVRREHLMLPSNDSKRPLGALTMGSFSRLPLG
ncbi:ankyrin repeat [Cedratvirus lausannensis]|uniref:Ankyrin repeat n=1 Tax=Cedratvirus lausannensis TaxID=2023205 RepID=A0A285PWW6_9VIRU|nr:ankyrin repeat [Cedratvirus lausannensis]